MKDIDTKHRLIELRALGKSLRVTADELGIGFQTAVKWDRELKEQIENNKALELEELAEAHRLNVESRIERYGVEFARLTEEIKKRNLAEVPTAKLYELMIKLDARIEEVRPSLTVRDDDEIADQKRLHELVAKRRVRKASKVNKGATDQDNGTVYADDLVTLQLTTLQRLRGGKITRDILNPTSAKNGGGTLASHTAALTINIVLSGTQGTNMPSGYGGLKYINPGDSLSGMTITQIRDAANTALGTGVLPSGYTYGSLTKLLENLNQAFDNGTPTIWAQTYLKASA